MKLKGLKKAVGERNSWIKRGYSYIANIMIDKENGEVWCDCFINSNSFKVYKSEYITNLNNLCYEYNMPITMRGIKIALAMAYHDGKMPYFDGVEKELFDYVK